MQLELLANSRKKSKMLISPWTENDLGAISSDDVELRSREVQRNFHAAIYELEETDANSASNCSRMNMSIQT
jgi:hypothetical protein